MELNIERIEKDPVRSQSFEIVERKGKGHPDTICDMIAEEISRRLTEEYEKRFDRVLHHNTDEVQLAAGQSHVEPGGGSLDQKIYLLLVGRATKKFEGESIPVERIAETAAKDYISENFEKLDPEHFEVETRIGESSADLEALYGDEVMSNDTSFGVSHGPLSRVEETVLKVEKNVRALKQAGEDVKVMAVREERELELSVAVPAFADRVSDLEEYKVFKNEAERTARDSIVGDFESVDVMVNTADSLENEDLYLTVTGTSAEHGDDGSVGRGNRLNGLITPMRSMSLEAPYGKNPEGHPGKIAQQASRDLASKIGEETGNFSEVFVKSQIGEPISESKINVRTAAPQEQVREIISDFQVG